MKSLHYSALLILSSLSISFGSQVNLFNEGFSFEHNGQEYTFPTTFNSENEVGYFGYAYNLSPEFGGYEDSIETIFWVTPPEDENGWLPTPNGFLELSLDYRNETAGGPEYVMGFSFSKDIENPYPLGPKFYGYLSGPSLDQLTGTVGGEPISLNVSQYFTEEGRNFLANSNNYINLDQPPYKSPSQRLALVTDWEEHGVVLTPSNLNVFFNTAKELNLGLEFQEGKWVPSQE
jgi:hypothetical protein